MYILNHKTEITDVSFEQFFRVTKYYFPPDSWWILSRNKIDVTEWCVTQKLKKKKIKKSQTNHAIPNNQKPKVSEYNGSML